MTTIKDEHEYLNRAMKAYDNPSAVTIEEFNKDLYVVMTVKKTLRKYYNNPDDVNIRKMINYFVVLYNCFGATATELLLYKISEKELIGTMIPIIAFLGWDISHIPEHDINSEIVQELIQL